MRGDDGNYAALVAAFSLLGWDVQLPQPPRWPRPRGAGAIMRGLDGIDLPFFAILNRFDFGPPLFYRKRRRMPEFGGPGVAGDEAPFPRPAWGWEIQGFAARRRGHLLDRATTLIEVLPFVPEPGAWALDPAEVFYRRRRGAAVEAEPSFLPLPRAVPWGYDHPETLFPRRRVKSILVGEPLIPVLPKLIWGFESGFPTLRRRRHLATDRNETIVVPRRPVWGYESVLPAPSGRRRRAVFDRGYELVTNFPPIWTSGWESTPLPQPPHPRPERAGALMRGDDGNYAGLIVPVFLGWEPTLFWPPHPRPEHAGGIMAGDLSGAWGPFIYLVPSGAIASDFAVYLATAFDIGQPP